MTEALRRAQINLRLRRALHAKLRRSASVRGLSLNGEILRRLEETFQTDPPPKRKVPDHD